MGTTMGGGRRSRKRKRSRAPVQFERDLIRERTVAGLAAARVRGRKGGRRPVLDDKKLALLRSLAKERDNSPAVICATLGISQSWPVAPHGRDGKEER